MKFFRNLKYRYEAFRLGKERRQMMVMAAEAAMAICLLKRMGYDISGMSEAISEAKKAIVNLDLEINLRRIAIRLNIPTRDAEFFNRQIASQRLGYATHREIKIN